MLGNLDYQIVLLWRSKTLLRTTQMRPKNAKTQSYKAIGTCGNENTDNDIIEFNFRKRS